MIGGPAAASSAIAAGPAGGASVRFVAAPGSGLDEVFPPRQGTVAVPGKVVTPNVGAKTFISAPADLSLSTASPSFSGRDDEGVSAACIGGRGQASTASASTQAPELKLSDWASTRNRCAAVIFRMFYVAVRLSCGCEASANRGIDRWQYDLFSRTQVHTQI